MSLFDPLQNNRKPAMMMCSSSTFHLHMRRKNRSALHLLSGNAPILEPESPQPRFDLAQFRPRIHQGAKHHVPADARKTVKISDTRTFHRCTAEIVAASRKIDTSLPSKSCQIRPLRRRARALHHSMGVGAAAPSPAAYSSASSSFGLTYGYSGVNIARLTKSWQDLRLKRWRDSMSEEQDAPRSPAHALRSVGERKPQKHAKFLIANLELEFHVSPIRISDLKFSNRKEIAVFVFIFPGLEASPSGASSHFDAPRRIPYNRGILSARKRARRRLVYKVVEDRIRKALRHHIHERYKTDVPIATERPPKLAMGEAASPVCFELAKRLKKPLPRSHKKLRIRCGSRFQASLESRWRAPVT